MVHATEYFPKDGVIKSSMEATGARRNTIHTALNCHVGSHLYGNWVGHPIVIVDPLNEHVDQLACIYSVDTYTYGSMKLSDDAIILIDSSKFNEIYQQNKEYIDQNRDKVILFSGDSSKIVEQVIGILGYAPQKTGTWSWEDKHNDDMLNQYVQNKYPNILNSPHMATPHKIYEESWVRNILLPQYGYDSLATDKIITPEILYIIRKRYENTPTEDFIRNVGVFVDENEIHLLGMKDYLELWKSKDAISPQQVRKIDMITEKYELMQKYQEENSHSK